MDADCLIFPGRENNASRRRGLFRQWIFAQGRWDSDNGTAGLECEQQALDFLEPGPGFLFGQAWKFAAQRNEVALTNQL